MSRLIEWDRLHLRLTAEKLVPMIGAAVLKSGAPVSQLSFGFAENLIRVEGKIQKGIAIPFTIEISDIETEGKSALIPLKKASAFGIPLPSFLVSIAQFWLHSDEITYDAPSRSLRVQLDRFLPPFTDVDIQAIRPFDGGIAVILGAGGADLPEGTPPPV
jgi:hypothetical protein